MHIKTSKHKPHCYCLHKSKHRTKKGKAHTLTPPDDIPRARRWPDRTVNSRRQITAIKFDKYAGTRVWEPGEPWSVLRRHWIIIRLSDHKCSEVKIWNGGYWSSVFVGLVWIGRRFVSEYLVGSMRAFICELSVERWSGLVYVASKERAFNCIWWLVEVMLYYRNTVG